MFAGITLDSPIVTSCGTGVTACILALVNISQKYTHIIIDRYTSVWMLVQGDSDEIVNTTDARSHEISFVIMSFIK